MKTSASELLGFPPDARLLILNIDDFGMSHTADASAIETLERGTASSCTVMMPPAWARYGCSLLRERPAIHHGIHLTTISEHVNFRWRPLLPPEKVPTLVDEEGFLPLEERKDDLLRRAALPELEAEWRAQIEAGLAQGLRPDQLDSHCNIHDARDDVFWMAVSLAREYGLALRLHEPRFAGELARRGLPVIDHVDVDSFDLPTAGKSELYLRMLRELPPGLSEWAIHPARGTDELKAINPRWEVRAADYDFFNSAACAREIERQGIQVVSYGLLRELWRK